MSKLDQFFFKHLKSATKFSLKAPNIGPLGLKGQRHADLVLNAEHMPMLLELRLENVFICPELVEFLFGHVETLESVTLNWCFCEIKWSDNGMSWCQFFTALSDANPQALRKLERWPESFDFEMGQVEEIYRRGG
jgi:hypothetical protein